MSEAIEKTLESLGTYSAGFVTDIESDKAPKGLNEDIVRFISAKKNDPRMVVGVAVEGVSSLAENARADMGGGVVSRHRLSRRVLLRRAEDGERAEVLGRSRSALVGNL